MMTLFYHFVTRVPYRQGVHTDDYDDSRDHDAMVIYGHVIYGNDRQIEHVLETISRSKIRSIPLMKI